MASSGDIYNQMMDVQRGMNPLLDQQGNAPDYFRKKITEAYNYNLPAIKNAAALEAGAYTLPGNLMNQYDQEYGGKTGVGSMARMNSILKNMGQQFGMSNAAWNMVDKNQMRMEDMVKGVTDQYMGALDAYKTKWGMLSPLWQTLYGEEQAAARAAANRRWQEEQNKSEWENFLEWANGQVAEQPNITGTTPPTTTGSRNLDNALTFGDLLRGNVPGKVKKGIQEGVKNFGSNIFGKTFP